MSKCEDCRKAEELDTPWEKITRWLLFMLFPKCVSDISQEKYTQGFGDGYKTGFQHMKDNAVRERGVIL